MIKQLLKKTQLIKYCWETRCYKTRKPLWCAEYLIDSIDKESCLKHIENSDYDLNAGIYFYKSKRNNFILIGILTKKGLKLLK